MPDTKTKKKTVTRPRISPKENFPEPHMYRVIYINDETTTVEFVVESLKVVFGHSDEKAQELTVEIHERGAASVAVLPYEMAEQKGMEVTVLARENGFPLQVKLEADT